MDSFDNNSPTVSIFLLFFVNDNVDEFALRNRAAGAIGGIGGAKGMWIDDPLAFDDPFR